MNFADEIEQAKKEEEEAFNVSAEGMKEGSRLYKEQVDIVFSHFYEEIIQKDQFFIEKIQSLKIVNVFDELIKYGNLVYEYEKVKVNKQVSTFFASKTITETSWKAIPAIISISRDKQKGIYDGANLLVSKDQGNNWIISLSDFRCWNSYQNASINFLSTKDEDFQNKLDKKVFEIKSLKIDPPQWLSVSLTWDYEYPDYDISGSGRAEQIRIEVSKDFVKVSSAYSIPLENCTPQWIKHEVAREFSKYLSRKKRD